MIFHNKSDEAEFYREKFKTECKEGYDETERNIVLDLSTMSVIIEGDNIVEENVYDYTPLELKHFFNYNGNKLDPNTGSLKVLFDKMISQSENGRTEFVLTINASASKVPTKTYNNNMELAKLRANNVLDLLKKHVESHDELKGKVEFEINKIGVNGPAYKSGSFTQIEVYSPHQYVIIQLNGKTEGDAQTKVLMTKDNELNKMPN